MIRQICFSALCFPPNILSFLSLIISNSLPPLRVFTAVSMEWRILAGRLVWPSLT